MKNKNFDNLKLENQICHRLYLASNTLTRAYRPLLDQIDLTYPQYVIMMALWEQDNISMGELRSTTGIDKGFLTTLMKALEKKSLIKYLADSDDLRKKIITLTKKGIFLKNKASNIPDKMSCNFDLPKDFNAQELIVMLDAIITNSK